MANLIIFNKPFQVLSQFTDRSSAVADQRATLADFLDAPGFRAAGRLDYDSEGLLLLTDDGVLQQQIANPAAKTWKCYWAQVEGIPDQAALSALRSGVNLKDGMTLPAKARSMEVPNIWPRLPAVRFRAALPTSWIELQIREGRNRQVRRMTAAVGLPTLRLIRSAVGNWQLEDLAPGEFRSLQVNLPKPQPLRSTARRRS